jgi:hypothetical protein
MSRGGTAVPHAGVGQGGKALARALAAASVLSPGARGKVRPRARRDAPWAPAGPFRLAARVGVRSESGAIWNEWTLAFDDGRTAWLAEARGTFTLYAEAPIAPDYGTLEVGAALTTGLVVVERGRATRIASEGNAAVSPRSYRYVDLSGDDGDVVSIDYGAPVPRVFRGRSFALADLGLAPRAERPRFLPVTGFPETPPKAIPLWLALGDEGTLERTTWRVIATLCRSVLEDGERYGWQEYVLHDPAEGFRWLVVSDGHWSLVESVEPGRVRADDDGARLDGVAYAPLSEGRARLDWAAGELPWELTPREATEVRDYVRSPHLLSREASDDEVSWSRATYLPTAVLAKAFGMRALPKPRGRAPHAPKK